VGSRKIKTAELKGMEPLTKIAAVGLACLCLLLGALGVRLLVLDSALPASVAARAHDEARVEGVHDEGLADSASQRVTLAVLTDFRKLGTLNAESRSINAREKKILYWLHIAERQGVPPEIAIDEAFEANGNSKLPQAKAAKSQTLANFRAAKIWGLFTSEGLAQLKRGKAARISRGTFEGEYIEIDHIVPLARYPQFANELANLQIMPMSQNRAKGDRMGAVEFAKLRELQSLLNDSNPVTIQPDATLLSTPKF
jgi:hypothetical protein